MRESNQILSEENKVLKKSNHDKDKEIAKKNLELQKQENEIAKYRRMIHAFTTSPQRNLARMPDSSGTNKALADDADSDGVEMPRRALFDSTSKYFVGTKPGINSRDGRKYIWNDADGSCHVSREWRQLLSSILGNETLRNIARDVGDKE